MRADCFHTTFIQLTYLKILLRVIIIIFSFEYKGKLIESLKALTGLRLIDIITVLEQSHANRTISLFLM
jgi:hypothetical protein